MAKKGTKKARQQLHGSRLPQGSPPLDAKLQQELGMWGDQAGQRVSGQPPQDLQAKLDSLTLELDATAFFEEKANEEKAGLVRESEALKQQLELSQAEVELMKSRVDALDGEKVARQKQDAMFERLASFAQMQLAQWHWCDGTSDWAFSAGANYNLERAYSEKKASIVLQSGRYAYEIDFAAMEQRNTETGKTRAVKRVVMSAGNQADAVQAVELALQARIQEAEAHRKERQDAQDELKHMRKLKAVLEDELARHKHEASNLAQKCVDLKAQADLDTSIIQRLENRIESQGNLIASLRQDLVIQSQEADSQSEQKSALEELQETLHQQIHQLSLKNDELKESVERAQANSLKTANEQLKIVGFWRKPVEPLKYQVLSDPFLLKPVCSLFATLSHSASLYLGEPSKCAVMHKAKVKSVKSVHNPHLWKKYCDAKEELKKVHKSLGVSVRQLSPASPSFNLDVSQDLDSSLNEVLLFHGCSEDAASSIMAQGFDSRYAEETGLYGEGIYFASQPCKCMQYSGRKNTKFMFVARVALGDPAYLKQQVRSKLPPPRQDIAGARFDSSVVNPEDSQRGQAHREFVLFDSARVYPELLIEYTI